jgi:uncharacterized membrane protein YphA (DoxX/SURF4 family)
VLTAAPTRRWVSMDNLKTYVAPIGRLLLASLFIWSGATKLHHSAAAASFF